MCVGPHGSGTRNVKSSLLLKFARFIRLKIAGSWFQRSEPRRWSWYSNAGGDAKEIDHILVSTRWRILKNCRVYRSFEFFGTDHRFVVATLRLHLKTQRITRSALPQYNLDIPKNGINLINRLFQSIILDQLHCSSSPTRYQCEIHFFRFLDNTR